MDFFVVIFVLAGLMLSGTLLGLIPFFLGRYMGKPGLGKLGLLCCILSSILLLQLPVAIGFVLAVIIKKQDFYWPQRSAAPRQQSYQSQPVQQSPAAGI